MDIYGRSLLYEKHISGLIQAYNKGISNSIKGIDEGHRYIQRPYIRETMHSTLNL